MEVFIIEIIWIFQSVFVKLIFFGNDLIILEGTVGKLLLERIFWGKKQLLAVIVWR
jgi:hypothetical protein